MHTPTHVVIYSKNLGWKWHKYTEDFLLTCLDIDSFEPQYGDIYWFFV